MGFKFKLALARWIVSQPCHVIMSCAFRHMPIVKGLKSFDQMDNLKSLKFASSRKISFSCLQSCLPYLIYHLTEIEIRNFRIVSRKLSFVQHLPFEPLLAHSNRDSPYNSQILLA